VNDNIGPRLSDITLTDPLGTIAAGETSIIPKRNVTHEEIVDPRQQELEFHTAQILTLLGYSLEDQHFKRTPGRVAEVLLDYRAHDHIAENVKSILEVQFIEPYVLDSLVMEGPIRYISRCAHHLEPVDGKAWVAYIPNEAVCGLSKLARVVHYFAKQLTVQEVVTKQIADALENQLKPQGVMIVIEASHGCMQRRGVMEPSAFTTTSVVKGVFKESATARNEFLLLKKG